MTEKIQITGLRELQKALRDVDDGLPKQLRLALNEASEIIVDYAQARMPRKSGRAAASLKARSSQRVVRVALGGKRAPYAPWLDFGGQGRIKGRPPKREFIRSGRYVYKGLEVKRDQVTQVLTTAITDLVRSSGLEVH